ncbi:uncharacterized protein LOC112562904 isoform X1 [Pomacea canaliculata]|uniref:uncharacterized protein LOC112562904 isoform X1 n=1 Tax=Pomacea canaliculata TaxID=400727 RepID=UPI000D73818E|nr:uncharacterized protein LOC112562904 isoform X1 [Pomacea canaliculata]
MIAFFYVSHSHMLYRSSVVLWEIMATEPLHGQNDNISFHFCIHFFDSWNPSPVRKLPPFRWSNLSLIFLFYGSCHTLIGAALNIWFSQGRGLMQPPSQQFCDTCKVMLNSPEQAHQHYQGARHAKRLKLVVKGPRNDGATPGESESDPHHGFFFCSFCNVYVNSVQQMTIHREGSKHKKMVEAKKRAAEEQSLDMQPPTKTPKIDRGQTVSGRGQTVSGRDKLFLAGDKLFLAGDKLFLPEDKLFLPEGKILLATEETSLLVAEGKALLLGEAKTLLRLHQSP